MKIATTGTIFCQFLTRVLDIPDELTIPSALLVEEFHFQWQQRARYIRIKAEPEHIVT